MKHLKRLLMGGGSMASLLIIIAISTPYYANPAAQSLLPSGVAALGAPASSGTSLYVDSTIGSDANPGTASQPWKTIQKAANGVLAGQTVSVAGGMYNEHVSITRSGSSGAPIVFVANGKVIVHSFSLQASYVTIHGFEITDPVNTASGWGVYLTGHYDTIENNYIHDMSRGGILLYANIANPTQTSNIIVQYNTIYHVAQLGIDVRGRNNLVRLNDISGIMQYAPWVTNPPKWADADGIHFHGRGHIFSANKIHDILYGVPAGNFNPHIDCFQTFYSAPDQEAASSILFDRNSCIEPTRNSVLGIAAKLVQAEGASNLKFTNNVVYTFLAGIVKNGNGVSFLNNTFVVPSIATNGQGLQFVNEAHVTVQNNIFSNQSSGIGALSVDSLSKPTFVAGYNCLWKQGNRVTYPGDVWGKDPLFVNGSSDFHLQAGSPCIDHGMPVNVNHDMDYRARPQGAGFDMGAYEY